MLLQLRQSKLDTPQANPEAETHREKQVQLIRTFPNSPIQKSEPHFSF